MPSGLFLTTNLDVYSVYRDGARFKVANQRSLFIPWNELFRVNVEGKISKQCRRSFFPPELTMGANNTKVLSIDMHYNPLYP